MEDPKIYVFAKFKINRELDIMEGLMLSESRSTVDEWTGPRSKKSDPDPVDEPEQPNPFQKVAREFEASINTYQRTVPFIMQALPFMRQLSDDRKIRRFVAEKGDRLETGEFELYRISLDHMNVI